MDCEGIFKYNPPCTDGNACFTIKGFCRSLTDSFVNFQKPLFRQRNFAQPYIYGTLPLQPLNDQ